EEQEAQVCPVRHGGVRQDALLRAPRRHRSHLPRAERLRALPVDASSAMTRPAAITREEIVFDWNQLQAVPQPQQSFDRNDDTLRDGVQSPSVVDPGIDDKLALIELMASLGIGSVNIGLPGAGRRAFDDVVAIARHITKRKLKILPNCAARTVVADI